MKDILFKKVKCNAYLKKVYDGKFIDVSQDDFKAIYTDYSNLDKLYTESTCEGDLDFLKTYYEFKEKEFTGLVVGIKDVTATAYLVADTGYQYNGKEYIDVGKEAKDIYKCAIVYYGNNRKRYVPLENIEVGD